MLTVSKSKPEPEPEPEPTETPFETKCGILSELWMDYRDDVNFDDLFNYGDLGFPIAYAIENGIVEETDKARAFIDELFDLLVSSMGLEDEGFEDLDDIFLSSETVIDDDEEDDD